MAKSKRPTYSAEALTPVGPLPKPELHGKIRLSFVLGSGLSSRFIAWYGQGFGGWSHVDAVLKDGYFGARSDAVGGQPPGVYLRPFGYESWVRHEILERRVTLSQEAAWERNLRAKSGDHYDRRSIVAFLLGLKTEDHPGYWICSACQTDAMQDPGVSILPAYPIPPAQVTPDSLHIAAWTAGFRPISPKDYPRVAA